VIIGVIWYLPPVLGRAWAAGVASYTRVTEADLLAPSPRPLLGWIVAFAVQAFVLAGVLGLLGVTTVDRALAVAALVWLGFSVTFGAWPPLFARMPWRVYAINAGASLLQHLAMGTILTLAR
jgi:hypothetical protein